MAAISLLAPGPVLAQALDLKLGTVLGTLPLGSAAASAAPAASSPDVRVFPLDVTLNGVASGLWPILQSNGEFFAPAEAFPLWRVVTTEEKAIGYRGLPYLPIRAISGADVAFNANQSLLAIQVPARSFALTSLEKNREGAALPRDPVEPSAFFNYDANLGYSVVRGAPISRSVGVLGEIGYSDKWGVLTSTFAARSGQDSSALLRLDTSLRRDDPDSGMTFKVGDSITRTSYLGQPAYFGGIQFSNNFTLAPHLNRQPIPVITGQTQAPSSVQLYVNNVLRQTNSLPPGPFTIDTLPAITGNGDVTAVVRDILGRETVITQPFFVTAELLAPGLNDWSFELGALRQELGVRSWSYGPAFASGVLRRGITNDLTLEGRAEAALDRQTAGGAGVIAMGRDYLLRGGVMASRDATLGAGSRLLAGFEWRGRLANLLVGTEANTAGFRNLADVQFAEPPKRQVTAQAQLQVSGSSRLGVGLAVLEPRQGPTLVTGSVSIGLSIGEAQVSINYSVASGAVSGNAFGAVLTVPLGNRISSSASVQTRGGQTDTYVSAAQGPEGAFGTAWRVLAGQSTQPRFEGGVYQFRQTGTLSADVSANPEGSNLRLGATGGLLYTAGRLFAVMRHDQSAVVVDVPGLVGVGVGLGGQSSAVTDGDGVALVSRLNPYEAKGVRLNPNDLPITAEIENLERRVVPMWRSVARATYQVRAGRAALLKIVLDDGANAPTGAIVRLSGDDREFWVGRGGDAYVTGLQAANKLSLEWKGNRCTIDVAMADGLQEDVPKIGPLACKGVAR
jgi:outer membrane usher protein